MPGFISHLRFRKWEKTCWCWTIHIQATWKSVLLNSAFTMGDTGYAERLKKIAPIQDRGGWLCDVCFYCLLWNSAASFWSCSSESILAPLWISVSCSDVGSDSKYCLISGLCLEISIEITSFKDRFCSRAAVHTLNFKIKGRAVQCAHLESFPQPIWVFRAGDDCAWQLVVIDIG